MDNEKLNRILREHSSWLINPKRGIRADLSGTDLTGADLTGANLTGADLSGTDLAGVSLCYADLRSADLTGADLTGANLTRADLSGTDLAGVSLCYADLRSADLTGADLYGSNLWDSYLKCANLESANLRYSNLMGATLIGANLTSAKLTGAILTGADLTGANLYNISHSFTTSFYALCCPEEGSFIGYKEAHGKIVKLKILSTSKRISGTSRICRCDKAKVLSITNLDGTKCKTKKINSNYDPSFIYTVGEIVEVNNFDNNRWVSNTTGIHFFITRDEAVKYDM